MSKRKRGHPTDYPCHFTRWDDVKNKDVPDVPAVNCNRNCMTCAWNPEEAERRLKTGKFVKHGKVRTLVFRGLYDELLHPGS